MVNRIVRLHEIGGPGVLTLEAAAPEPPGPGEALLKVEAIGLNNSEAQLRRGDYPVARADLPTRLGRECAGEIVALGAGASGFVIGEPVSTIATFDVKRHGVYGDWAVVPVEALVRTPPRLSRQEAAAVWQACLTAYGPLVAYERLQPGEAVVVLAASSSVGRAALQVARWLGCATIAVTRSAAKREALIAGGADHVVVSSSEPVGARVLELTGGRGARVALDPVTGPGVADLVRSLAPGGVLYVYGQLDSTPTPMPFVDLMRRGVSIRGYTLWELTLDPARRAAATAWIYDRLERGDVRPVIDRVFPLSEIAAAHAYLESGAQTGKIVVTTAEERAP